MRNQNYLGTKNTHRANEKLYKNFCEPMNLVSAVSVAILPKGFLLKNRKENKYLGLFQVAGTWAKGGGKFQ